MSKVKTDTDTSKPIISNESPTLTEFSDIGKLTRSESEHINHIETKLKQTICDEFVAVCAKYYAQGCYVIIADQEQITASIEFSPGQIEIRDGIEMKKYNVMKHVCAYKYNRRQFASGELIAPTKAYNDAIFEELFRFGCDCKGFTTNRVMYKFPQHPKWTCNELYNVINSATLDQNLLRFLLWISVFGGYVNDAYECLGELNLTLASLIGCEQVIDPHAFVLPFANAKWFCQTKRK